MEGREKVIHPDVLVLGLTGCIKIPSIVVLLGKRKRIDFLLGSVRRFLMDISNYGYRKDNK